MTNFTEEEWAEYLRDNPEVEARQQGQGKQGGGIILPVSGNTPQDLRLAKVKGQNKYHIAPKEDRIYNGRCYPSKWQATKAQELDLIKRAGKIKGYIEEVSFRLPGTFTDRGGRRRQASHRVDFGIIELDNTVTWLERKGRELPMGKLKRMQVEAIYGIRIVVE